MTKIVVRSERLALRRLGPDDRTEFIRVRELSRDHFKPWLPAIDPDRTLEDVFEYELNRTQAGWPRETEVRLVGMLVDGSIGGFFALSQIFRRAFQNAYASWMVPADRVGCGLATEGVRALLDVAFAPEPLGLGLHRVQGNVIASNVASVRVAEKAGFRLEGTAERYLEIDGRWQDHLMFAKTREEHTLRYLVSGAGLQR